MRVCKPIRAGAPSGPIKQRRSMAETIQDREQQTFSRLLLQHAQTRPEQPPFREKDLGIWHYTQSELSSYEKVQQLGREFDRAHPGFFEDAVNAGRPQDVAVILYTSGTTGKPKGVCHSHAAMLTTARVLAKFDRLDGDN